MAHREAVAARRAAAQTARDAIDTVADLMTVESLLATALVLGLAFGALLLIARSWPRSSSIGGYRSRLHGSRDEHSETPTDPGVREEDDVHWDWPDRPDQPRA